MPLNFALPEGKPWRAPINMTSRHRVSTACSILVSQDSQSANPNRTDKAGASGSLLSRSLLSLDLALPEGKSWRVPINLTSLHRVPTAFSILVSQDSQSANLNRTDKAGASGSPLSRSLLPLNLALPLRASPGACQST